MNPDRRETEDEMARRALGGVKGNKDLQPAPLTPNERRQTPIKDSDEDVSSFGLR
ncbi:MAG: hypothetical protein JO254_09155 [Pseudolabrys sp.]|nr:hypothetical protein [Pseudolabrys sp.]